MKILFITDNFPPEVNAPASRTYEHTREWVKKGEDVTVITCFPNFPYGKTYDGYRNGFIKREVIEGIKVIRVWSFMAPNRGFFLRMIDFISFALMSFIIGFMVKTDVIVTTSPQFFSAVSSSLLSVLKRKKIVLEIRDMWPQQIVASTNLSNDHVLIRFFYWLSKKVYLSADLIVTVTKTFSDEIANIISPYNKKYEVVFNGVDRKIFYPREKNEKLEYGLGIKGKKVISYIGTHGLNQNLSFIIKAISKLNNPDVHFLFVGTGADKEKIMSLSERLEVKNITFVDQVSKGEVVDFLSVTDVSLVPLRNSETYHGVIPSKIFENAAMGIPVLLGVDGEARAIVEGYGSGLYYIPENESDFIEKLNLLIQDDFYKYSKGCDNLAIAFNREFLALKMLEAIKRVV